jgi:hypothetical protein
MENQHGYKKDQIVAVNSDEHVFVGRITGFGACKEEDWGYVWIDGAMYNYDEISPATTEQISEILPNEKFQWINGDGICWECGKPFPTENLQNKADEHEKEYPGFRRIFTQCPYHNYGNIALFERDCEYKV